jgi:hypothetical protein
MLKMIIKKVEKDAKMIRIYNVYNSSLILYTSKDSSFTLSKITRFIVETFDDHHILLKNFNFHFFSETIRFAQHNTSRQIIYST